MRTIEDFKNMENYKKVDSYIKRFRCARVFISL